MAGAFPGQDKIIFPVADPVGMADDADVQRFPFPDGLENPRDEGGGLIGQPGGIPLVIEEKNFRAAGFGRQRLPERSADLLFAHRFSRLRRAVRRCDGSGPARLGNGHGSPGIGHFNRADRAVLVRQKDNEVAGSAAGEESGQHQAKQNMDRVFHGFLQGRGYSPAILAAKRVPRMAMVPTGVSSLTDSGESLAITPDR